MKLIFLSIIESFYKVLSLETNRPGPWTSKSSYFPFSLTILRDSLISRLKYAYDMVEKNLKINKANWKEQIKLKENIHMRVIWVEIYFCNLTL